MEKDRGRGLKHIQDKKKYNKANSTKKHVPAKTKQVPAKAQPNLGSNWDRYEAPQGNECGHELSSSTDFALLAGAPLTMGSHHQFRSDALTSQAEPELFSLDLDLLARSIMSVPFWRRLDISKDYFSDSQIRELKQSAKKHREAYEAFLRDRHEAAVPSAGLGLENLKIEGADEVEEEEENDILELIVNAEDNDVEVTELDSKSADLEQWLDDILED